MTTAKLETLGRFGHDKDPATDFCMEVDAIGEAVAQVPTGSPLSGDLHQRIGGALNFTVGGHERSVAAKQRLREFAEAFRDERRTYQARVGLWMQACFGPEIATDWQERNHRFLEESLELVQANGCTRSEAHKLVDYVFDRKAGDPHQEVGGVMVTVAALCLAAGLDMSHAAEDELVRVWANKEKIRAKQAAKPKHSPLPAAPAPQAFGVEAPPAALPKGPYEYETTAPLSGSHGNGHVYLVDSDGKKIASIWGKPNQKMALVNWIIDASEAQWPST